MSDRYQSFSDSAIGKIVVKNLGLPDPTVLDRWTPGGGLVEGTVGLGGNGRVVDQVRAALETLEVATDSAPAAQTRYKGLVFDATGISSSGQLSELRDFFAPLMRSLAECSRLVVIGSIPELLTGSERVAQRALEGFTRSLGKEVGRGGTATLILVAEGAEAAIDSTLAFTLSPKSAYVSGQVVRVGAVAKTAETFDWRQPLEGKVAVVTGAARGIGEQIARVLHRDGARVVGIDVPGAASDLNDLAAQIDGDFLTLDITAPDAPARIAHELKTKHGGVDAIVHNAGITRDKRLANMDTARWDSVIAVNLTAPELITAELLKQGLIRANGRIVGVSSIAGIAGNVGQTNYAASKAGVIGLVDALKDELPDGITINAVAPGFIETKMTAAVPLLTREVGRRLNAMSQGGQPVDVAEAVAWFCSAGSTAVTGNVVRVCGQMMLGA